MVGRTRPYMALIIQQSIYISWGGGGFRRLLIFGVDGWYNPPLHLNISPLPLNLDVLLDCVQAFVLYC